MTKEERRAHEIEASADLTVRTTFRRLLLAVSILCSGGGAITVSTLLYEPDDTSAVTKLESCKQSTSWLTAYATKCHKYIQQQEKLRTSEHVSLPHDKPEFHFYHIPEEEE